MNLSNNLRIFSKFFSQVLPILLASLSGFAAASELDALFAVALASNPRVQAARYQVEQTLAKHAETLGFFDPQLVVAAGKSERSRVVPGSTVASGLTDNATVIRGGVEMAMRPGFYFSAGTAENFLTEPGAGHGSLFQTLLGMQLRIPLLRDCGFRKWHAERASALAEYGRTSSHLLTVTQELRHDVEQAYVGVLEAMASYKVAQDATASFKTLVDEARALTELKVVPEYQIFPADMELQLQREDELKTKESYETSIVRLRELLGNGTKLDIDANTASMIKRARKVRIAESVDIGQVLNFRGPYREILNQICASEADLLGALEDTRSDLSLTMTTTWQGEDPHNPVGYGRELSGKHVGGEVMLLWKRPLGFRSERSRITQARLRIRELRQSLRQVELQICADMEVATIALSNARKRLQLVSRAVTAAQQTLTAEQERFRLGGGRSRDVLDAQKDVITAIKRQTNIGAELLRAHSNFLFASGYMLPPPSDPKTE